MTRAALRRRDGHTWHEDVDGALHHVVCFVCAVCAVEAGVVAAVHGGGAVHANSGDKEAAVVFLCLLWHVQGCVPGDGGLSLTCQGEGRVEGNHQMI